jgi:hypothetical protein
MDEDANLGPTPDELFDPDGLERSRERWAAAARRRLDGALDHLQSDGFISFEKSDNRAFAFDSEGYAQASP